MISRYRWTLLAVVALCLSAAPLAVAPHDEGALDGVYEFVRIDSPDGPMTNQKGMMIVKDGYICHLRVAKEREAFAQGDSDEQRAQKAAAAFQSANGTCGSYSAGEGKITANWTTALSPNTEGNSTDFLVEQDGDMLMIAPAAAPQFKFVYKKK